MINLMIIHACRDRRDTKSESGKKKDWPILSTVKCRQQQITRLDSQNWKT
jgi:hypothetical protein